MNGNVGIERTRQKTWRVVRWPLLAVALFYLFGVAMMVFDWWRTPAAVERIHARTVTMDMVMGKNAPPLPSAELRDKTVAGVDANNNGIRDDVELAIARNHPTSAKIRAAELQYAMALQSQLTDVFSSGTLVAVLQENQRGTLCIDNTHQIDWGYLANKSVDDYTPANIAASDALFKQHNAVIEPLQKEVENLVLNTSGRQSAYKKTYDYMTSYGGSKKSNDCDVDLKALPN